MLAVEGLPLGQTLIHTLDVDRIALELAQRRAHLVGFVKMAAGGVDRDTRPCEPCVGFTDCFLELIGHGAGGDGIPCQVRRHHHPVERHGAAR